MIVRMLAVALVFFAVRQNVFAGDPPVQVTMIINPRYCFDGEFNASDCCPAAATASCGGDYCYKALSQIPVLPGYFFGCVDMQDTTRNYNKETISTMCFTNASAGDPGWEGSVQVENECQRWNPCVCIKDDFDDLRCFSDADVLIRKVIQIYWPSNSVACATW